MKPIRKQIQEALDEEGEDYILKTDEELINYISENGSGFYEFNAYDIERILVENMRMKEILKIDEI